MLIKTNIMSKITQENINSAFKKLIVLLYNYLLALLIEILHLYLSEHILSIWFRLVRYFCATTNRIILIFEPDINTFESSSKRREGFHRCPCYWIQPADATDTQPRATTADSCVH